MSYEDVRKQLSMAFSKDPNKSDGYNTARQQLVESFGGVPSKRPGGTGITRKPEPEESLFGSWLKNLSDIGNKVDTYAGYLTDDVTIANARQPTTERTPAVGRLADLWQNAIDTNPRTSVSTGSQFMGGGQPIPITPATQAMSPEQQRAMQFAETKRREGEAARAKAAEKPVEKPDLVGQATSGREAAIEAARPYNAAQETQPTSMFSTSEETAGMSLPEYIEARKKQIADMEAQRAALVQKATELSMYGAEYTEEINDIKAQISAIDEQFAALQKPMTFKEHAASATTAAFSGLEAAGLGVTNALEWLLGEKSLPWAFLNELATLVTGQESPLAGKNPVTALQRQGQQEVAYWQNQAAIKAAGNDLAEKVGKHAASIAQSSPFILMNILSLGVAGTAAAGTTEGLSYVSTINSSPALQQISTIAAKSLEGLASNPTAQYSFVSTFGSSYQDALNEGATESEATVYALLNGAFGTIVEMGGGLEAMPEQLLNAMQGGGTSFTLEYAKDIAHEIGEEEIQRVLELGLKFGYSDVEWLDQENPDAILNMGAIGETAVDTAIDTAIMGGAQNALQYGANAIVNAVQPLEQASEADLAYEDGRGSQAPTTKREAVQEPTGRQNKDARLETEEDKRSQKETQVRRDVDLDFSGESPAAEDGVFQSKTSDGTGYATVKEEDGSFTAYVEGENGEAVEVGSYENAGDASEAAVETIQGEEITAEQETQAVSDEAAQEKPAAKVTPRPRAAAQETVEEATAQRPSAQVKDENRKAVMESIIEREAGRAGTEISASEKSALADAFNIEDGVKGSTYAAAVVEAYSLGKEGTASLEEARRGSRNGERISASQFQRAFELGRGETASGRTVAVRTKAQSDSLRASLASLGQYAGAAAKAYENGQDIGEYAAAMSEAAERYAVTGADIRAQGGVPADSVISMLTDAQIEKAQEIGGRLRAQRAAAISQLAEQRKAIRAQAREIERQNAADADALTEINRQIREANKIGKDTVALFEAQREAIIKAVEADPDFQDTEEYAKAFDEAKANMEKVKDLQRAVEDLNAKKKAMEAKKPTVRKKGTVSHDGGNIAGTEYKGIDRGKLTRQQQNIVAMVERLADLINIDYVVFDGPANMGGAYMQGGRIFININAGMTKAGHKSIAAASLSHELTHFMQEYAPEEYQQLKDYVIGTILNKSQTEFDRLVRQQRRWEPGKSYDELADELVANACQTMLTDDKAVQRMARSNMTLAQKVADVLDEIGEKIRKAFEGLSFDEDRAIFAPVKAVMDEIDGITERWADGISAAVENYNAEQEIVEGSKNAATESKTQNQAFYETEVYNGRAVVSEETLDKWLKDYAASNPNYAQAYIAYMSPLDYLRMTTSGYSYRQIIKQQAEGLTVQDALDFSKEQPIQLRIDTETGKVEGHEGRHRMAALAANGIEKVPVLLFDSRNKYSKAAIDALTLTGQDFHGKENSATANITDVQPLSRGNRDAVAEKFSRKAPIEKIGERYGRQTAQFQVWDDTTEDTASESRGRDIAYARLQSENAVLSETVAAMKKLTGKQDKTIAALQKRLQVTTTPEVRQSDARKLARQLIRDNGSKADAERVSEQIKALGDYLVQTDTAKLDENEMKNRARSIASEILTSATENISIADDTFSIIAGEIKGRKLSIDEDFLGELDQAGGYDAFRKSVFGSFTLAKRESASRETRDGYMTVDQFYTDMQGQYGKGLFPDAANEGEQVQILAQMLDAAKPMEVNPFEQYMGEATEELANRIVMDAMNGVLRQTAPTTADRQKARTQALKEQIDQLKAENKLEQREAASLYHTVYDLTVALDKAASKYQTLRTEADYRAAQLRAEGTARAAEIKAAERARADSKIKALREYYQRQRQRATEMRNNSANATKYRKQITKKVGVLRDMLVTNSDKVHVPEVLKAPLSDFLSSIDLSSKSLLNLDKATKADEKNHAAFLKLVDLFSRQQEYIDGNGNVQGDLGGYLDISKDSMEFLRGTATLIYEAMQTGQEYTINRMNAEQLKDLSNFLSNLTKAIRDMNNFMANARYESVQSAARADIEHMKALGKASEISASAAVRFAGWENGTPYYIMKRFGAGAKSIFDGFAKGWERLAFNAQEIIDFTENLYTDQEVRDWKRTTHDITLEDGSKIKMTTAQIMELSMLLGREQAVKHISRGGIRIGDIETKKGKIHDTAHYHLSDTDIKTITGMLSERQAEVAKKMQRYMADRGAEWGNEISMRRFGYKFYEEGPGYYPIKTDANDRPMADTDAQTNSMFRLLNLSASKALNPKASNALIVGDIFDTFADHMADMAKLNGMGLPILDAIKWFNYKERIDNDDGTYDTVTLQGAMEQAFGEQAQRYFRTLMKDINGVNESGDRGTNLPKKLMSNYKIAAVAANLRVAFLQPTSYVRAMTVLKPKYMVGIVPTRAAYREAMKYSGTAVWKALGYYETDISRGLREKIAHDDSFRDKFAEASLSLAELGDQTTWSMLWTACKRQAKAESPGIAQEALMEKTAELFREVVYSSQVMDSTLTRSEIMRGKTGWTKAMSAFMAEPTLSYNILMNAVSDLNLDERKLGRTEAWKRNSGKFGKAMTVYVASAAFAAVVESIADAVRDDDDEEFWEKFKQALWGEDGKWWTGNLAQDLTILGKLPYVKTFISTLQGYTSGDMSVAAFNNLVNVYKIWEETIKLQTGALDKATKVTSYGKMTEWGKVYKTLQALSQLSGYAVSNITRDVTAIWNWAMNGRKNEWKIRTYDPNALSQSETAAYNQYVKDTGVSKSQYQKILADANADGNSSISQDEMGSYLTDALRAKGLTKAQADAVWASRGWKPDHDLNWWAEKQKSVPKTAAGAVDPAYADYKKNVSIYDKDGAYEGWKNNLQGLGVSLDTFTKTINAANTDGNTSIKQDELGEYLYNQIQNKRMTEEEANAWFLVFWNGQRSKTYSMWEAKNKK